MNIGRRSLLQGLAATALLGGLTACTNPGSSNSSSASSPSATSGGTHSLTFDPKAWSYDETNDVYYQLGATYAATPLAPDYETLGIFVPGKYLTGSKNSDGKTFTATINASGAVAGFTASTAPIVMPVNTPGYSAQRPPSSYNIDTVKAYLAAGYVYVWAGMRGKDTQTATFTGNAPWGVTDLKAAVRYLRFNDASLPGDKSKIFVFGHSGGGAQSSVMGASGDSDLYTPYLKAIGAAMTDSAGKAISDAIAGVMAWCPITSLDQANAAYEWNMGQFASTGTRASGTWTAAYSNDLATSYASYINSLGLKNSSGATLALAASSTGTYLGGTYHDHLVGVLQESLNNFLADTTFPYTPSSQLGGMGGGPGGMPPAGAPGGGGSTSGSSSASYATIADYIASLNATEQWVTYDAASKKATVTSLGGFVRSQKNASKGVGAFDGPGAKATENVVFGLGTAGLHFDATAKAILAAHEASYASLTNWDASYGSASYATDLAKTDALGVDVATRVNMYNPMYYLNSTYAGHKKSTVAPHWRIRTGIRQGDTASTIEVNLALALANYGLKAVDFATVWGQGHTMAERTGDPATNFIAWVKASVA